MARRSSEDNTSGFWAFTFHIGLSYISQLGRRPYQTLLGYSTDPCNVKRDAALLDGMRAAVLTLKLLWRLVLLIFSHIITVPTYILWMVLMYPVRNALSELYWKMDQILMKGVHVVVAYWIYASGYHVVEIGDDLSDCLNKRTVMIANHQSTGDVPAMMLVLAHQDKGMLAGRLCWVMEHIFKFTQFGILCRLHGDFFIVQGKNTRHLQPQLLSTHLKDVYIPRNRLWVVLFPEGGFLHKRKPASQAYGRKNGFPILEHCTLPRLGALESILKTLGTEQTANGHGLKYLVDATMMYPKGKPLDVARMFFGLHEPCDIFVHYKKYLVSDIPSDTEGLTKWLFERYQEKDKMMAKYYATGKLEEGVKRPLDLDHFYVWCIFGAFFASTLVHVYLIRNIINFANVFLSVISGAL